MTLHEYHNDSTLPECFLCFIFPFFLLKCSRSSKCSKSVHKKTILYQARTLSWSNFRNSFFIEHRRVILIQLRLHVEKGIFNQNFAMTLSNKYFLVINSLPSLYYGKDLRAQGQTIPTNIYLLKVIIQALKECVKYVQV